MEHSWKFFQNEKCEYFPCHKMENINCKFCYCPLYHLKNCGGTFKFVKINGQMVKDCMGCTYPHEIENHDEIMATLMGKRPEKE